MKYRGGFLHLITCYIINTFIINSQVAMQPFTTSSQKPSLRKLAPKFVFTFLLAVAENT